MTGLYLVCMVVGGIFVLASAFGGALGGHDADAGHELGGHPGAGGQDSDHDHQTGHGAHGGLAHRLLPFFGIRFWTNALAAFGLTGVLLEQLAHTAPATTAILATVTGLAAGSAMSWATRLLRGSESQSLADSSDFILGRVLVAVRGGEPGKVRCQARGELIDLVAVARDGETIAEGTEVVVVEQQDSCVVVADRSKVMGAIEGDIARRGNRRQGGVT